MCCSSIRCDVVHLSLARLVEALTVLVCVSIQKMEDEFLAAAKRGDLPKVKKLIEEGCSAKAKNEVKYTHLSVYI